MRCKVKSINERNPCFLLLTGKAEDSKKTACDKQEEGEDKPTYCPLYIYSTERIYSKLGELQGSLS